MKKSTAILKVAILTIVTAADIIEITSNGGEIKNIVKAVVKK